MPRIVLLSVLLAAALGVGGTATESALASTEPNPMLSARVKKISSMTIAKWSSVLGRNWAIQPIAGSACRDRLGRDCRLAQWQTFIDSNRQHDRAEQIRRVHAFINRTQYREDNVAWGRSDYWAAPGEFFARGGDCEDYAIAKYLSLKQLGFDPRDMRILVLRDTRRRLLHAVLLLQVGTEVLVLDNNLSEVVNWKDVPHYRPLYSVNEIDFWLHQNSGRA